MSVSNIEWISYSNTIKKQDKEDIKKCIAILKKEIYNNDEKLMKNIELVEYLSEFLTKLGVDVLDIQAISNIIDILLTSESIKVQNTIYLKNLTTIIPSLNRKVRNIILNKLSI